MTPKEKAIELVQRFTKIESFHIHKRVFFIPLPEAKQCAIIAVDEIGTLKAESFDELPNPHHYFSRNYWIEVKQEIQKL